MCWRCRGFTVGQVLGIGIRPGWSWGAFAVSLGFNFVFWGLASLLWMRTGRVVRRWVHAPVERADDYPDARAFSRRRMVLGGGKALAGLGLGMGSWGLFGEARWFEVTRRQFGVRNLPTELDGLRIVQLSDIHHGAWMSLSWVRQIVEVTNSLEPDLVALTGDFVYRGLEYVRPVARELTRLRARVGVLGVLGNHDWSDGGGVLTKRVFAEEGLRLIDNQRVFVTPQRRLVDVAPREGLCIAGVGELVGGQVPVRAGAGRGARWAAADPAFLTIRTWRRSGS